MSPFSQSLLFLCLTPAVAVFYFPNQGQMEVPRPGKRGWADLMGNYPRQGRAGPPPADATAGKHASVLLPLSADIPRLIQVLQRFPQGPEIPHIEAGDVTGVDVNKLPSREEVMNVGVALKVMFRVFDTNGDGVISPEEFEVGMKSFRHDYLFC